jgi:hypothetical protein
MTVLDELDLDRALERVPRPANVPVSDVCLCLLFPPRQVPDAMSLERLAPFAQKVVLERARLASEDPAGETEAHRPLGPVLARAVLIEMTEIATRRQGSRPPAIATRFDPRVLLDRIGADPSATAGMVPCPAHEDERPSLSWKVAGDRVLLHCFAGCTFDEIRRAAA